MRARHEEYILPNIYSGNPYALLIISLFHPLNGLLNLCPWQLYNFFGPRSYKNIF